MELCKIIGEYCIMRQFIIHMTHIHTNDTIINKVMNILTLAEHGQRALVGKVNMDKKTTDSDYIESTENSIDDTLKFIKFVEEMKVKW